MFTHIEYWLPSIAAFFILFNTCTSESSPITPTLTVTSPGELEFTDVIIKREHDNLKLVCELRNGSPRVFVWNYLSGNGSATEKRYVITPQSGATTRSELNLQDLQLSDSGHYWCSAVPYSHAKYVLVQSPGPINCARGALSCGLRCVLGTHVCDGHSDCLAGEDESLTFCHPQPCARADRLNCSMGRCIPAAACCVKNDALCKQPTCCLEHFSSGISADLVEEEYPALYEDRHAPDDYGFIQSTIYTVTACALIFMIAVVLLVSAICKMHMKRAALRSYAHRYDVRYAQAYRFPPCYESRNELDARTISPHQSPLHNAPEPPPNPECTEDIDPTNTQNGLARLASMFTSRYRRVPTQPEVELQNVRASSLNSTPIRNRPRTRLDNYRSPTYCDLNTTDFYFSNPDTRDGAPELNYMATPLEFFRRRTVRSNSVVEQRPLTLQLGRFQLSIPRFGRRNSSERRPDTPNVAEINIEDLDFVRLNSNDTYTLNGRTIRLLGANFENYPILNEGNRPPPYTEAMRYKLYGPPPEYLSREGLDSARVQSTVDEEARSNIEMPPCYDEIGAGSRINENSSNGENNSIANNSNSIVNNAANNESDNATCLNFNDTENRSVLLNNNSLDTVTDTTNAIQNLTDNINNRSYSINNDNINSVIDSLPAIDSDVNANEVSVISNVTGNVVTADANLNNVVVDNALNNGIDSTVRA